MASVPEGRAIVSNVGSFTLTSMSGSEHLGQECSHLDRLCGERSNSLVRYTDAPARRDQILGYLRTQGYVSARGAAGLLDVSEMTIRRDLERLAIDGLLRRVPGGATLIDGAGTESFDQREVLAQAAKRAIATAALTLLEGAATIALDAGTTSAAIAAVIAPGTRVISHSLPVFTICEQRQDIEVVGLGGSYYPQTRSFGGPIARTAVADLAFDVAVLSAVAVTTDGFYCTVPWDAEMKQEFAARAVRTIVVADHSKAGQRAPVRFLRWDQVGALVTDAGIDAATRAAWEERTDVLIVAEP